MIQEGLTYAIVNVTAGILQGKAIVTATVSLTELRSSTTGYASSSVNLSTVIPAPSALFAIAPNGDKILYNPVTSPQLRLLAVHSRTPEATRRAQGLR